MQQNFESNGLQVVGLNVGGPDDRVKVKQFAADLGIRYPFGFSGQNVDSMFFLSGDQTIPQTFVFGKDGQMLKRFIGFDQNYRDGVGESGD